jgi:hypothetical protein
MSGEKQIAVSRLRSARSFPSLRTSVWVDPAGCGAHAHAADPEEGQAQTKEQEDQYLTRKISRFVALEDSTT